MSNLFLALLLLSIFLLFIGLNSPKISLFWSKKERTRKKSFLIYLISMITFFVLFGVTVDETEFKKHGLQSNDPLNITKDSIKALVGKNVPYNKWDKWGFPKTLDGTDGKYWVVYLDSANVSFVSDKNTDKILFIDFDKKSALKYISNLK